MRKKERKKKSASKGSRVNESRVTFFPFLQKVSLPPSSLFPPNHQPPRFKHVSHRYWTLLCVLFLLQADLCSYLLLWAGDGDGTPRQFAPSFHRFPSFFWLTFPSFPIVLCTQLPPSPCVRPRLLLAFLTLVLICLWVVVVS